MCSFLEEHDKIAFVYYVIYIFGHFGIVGQSDGKQFHDNLNRLHLA